ncbi:hypothetical protein SI65_02133 [Aspergillus cristatus]|uniref:DUF1996 domain-containing protein n=1 Tax=Aspergillus cristatus TaxID=573508 RepID=A0A1E3BT60_ASPCR|nr:hypothetical protein SI65_01750 [Aspergillus cristatus]ODM24543.1 hypothetical protein SI65_02133 [Aspergillus cristatus]
MRYHFMFKNIDPLVIPGKYTSHMHDFFGSDAINVSTRTSAELQGGCTTAENPNDFSTYWIPTLYYVNGSNYTAIKPYRFSAYYKELDSAEISIPQNLELLAGNVSATSHHQLDKNAGVQWFSFPTKTCKEHLQVLLLFPGCTNPKTLKYAYSANPDWVDGYGKNRCPIGMYRIPRLRFSIRYDLRSILPDGWFGAPPLKLSCGVSYCMHGDFINGWLPEAAENMVKDAPSNDREYFHVHGPKDEDDQGSECDAQDADPSRGTSDYWTSVRMMGASRNSTISRRHSAYHRLGL